MTSLEARGSVAMARRPTFGEEPKSRLAVWSGRLGWFALAVAALSIIIVRSGLLEVEPALATFAASLVFAVFALAAAVAAPPGNWPQWRGPEMNGTTVATNLPVRWSATENITWKLAMPDFSGSTPIIWNDHIFLNVADGTELYLLAVDRTKGTERWKTHLGSGNAKVRKQNMSSPSPVTDGKTVWVMTGTGVLKAVDFNGRELWARDIQKDYGRFGLNWGYASSPLLVRDTLFVQVLHGMKTHDPSYVMRIDKKTGKTVWRVERPTDAVRESPDSYTTPALWKYGKQTEIVITGGDYITGHDPATGKELWLRESAEGNRVQMRLSIDPLPLLTDDAKTPTNELSWTGQPAGIRTVTA